MTFPELPKPDFTNLDQFPASKDETPKVYQKGLIDATEDSAENNSL